MATKRMGTSERIVRTVATEADSDPVELPPLYDAIDPDALDALVDRMSNGTVSFAYAGYEVTVRGDESIDLDERSMDGSASKVAVRGD
ncbi:MAG: HalOD1 output domain-containing protein [Natronomonas sp.]|uniref:HalOD1 output domain-containing protein n=1 Tax=Natronomonas sp. TaxID=2184060 RepID=UPI00286FEE20|nr:HalOD1 output domain-containing protein [Natronomonas sp.]MDR9431077.1 HalOD1 output domain-containing protein [Natronomonas sp.]